MERYNIEKVENCLNEFINYGKVYIAYDMQYNRYLIAVKDGKIVRRIALGRDGIPYIKACIDRSYIYDYKSTPDMPIGFHCLLFEVYKNKSL